MPVSQRLLISCACCCLLVLVGQTARADFLGVASVVRTDLTICQDTSQDDIDEPLTVCNFFAVFNDPTGRLRSVGNSDISTTAPNGFFQHPEGNLAYSPKCEDIPGDLDLLCDTFVTIGHECGPPWPDIDETKTDGDFDASAQSAIE